MFQEEKVREVSTSKINAERPKIYVGTSGWHYEDWNGKFYPYDLNKTFWLNYYSQKFNTVEINNSFYNLPEPETFKKWASSTPGDFIFTVKASRYITHSKKLKNTSEALSRLISSSSNLGKKLALFLFQLPSNLKKNYEKLKNFLNILPDKYRYVFEFRDGSWFSKDIYELLGKNNCSIVISNSSIFPYHDVVTGSLCYIRMHGSKLYSSKYTDKELKETAEIILKYNGKGLPVFIYFNNDYSAYAVENANTLKNILKV